MYSRFLVPKLRLYQVSYLCVEYFCGSKNTVEALYCRVNKISEIHCLGIESYMYISVVDTEVI